MSNIGGMVNKTVMAVIAAVIFILVGIALGPTITDAVAAINSTSLMVDYPNDNTSIFMAGVIITLKDFLPFFYYLGIVLGGLALIWASTRTSS